MQSTLVRAQRPTVAPIRPSRRNVTVRAVAEPYLAVRAAGLA